jgi:ABC-type phosphate transport system substrate-binding protein
MRSRSKLMVGCAAITAAALNLALIAPANADIAPNATDIVGIGSDTVQNIANFMADGDPGVASVGVNSSISKNRVFSFDATPDANDRAGYLNGSTPAAQRPLTPSIVLRAGTSPVQRPNGSGAGITALLADPTHKINFVRSSRLPSAAEQGNAGAGVGGLHVIKISTDNLKVAAATVTNAPTALTTAQLVSIYQCLPTANNWNQFGGTAGTIIPLIPQTGSGTRNSFLADLAVANGGPAVTLGTCVVTTEENDPTAITGSASPVNTISPFSEGRNNLYGSGYFHDPAVAFPGAVASLTSGIQMLNGVGSYLDSRGLFIVFRDADKNLVTKWQPGSNLNWVQALFLNAAGTPYAASGDAQAAILAGGATPTYVDCGSGPGVTTC